MKTDRRYPQTYPRVYPRPYPRPDQFTEVTPGGGGAFSPSDITDMVAWYDAALGVLDTVGAAADPDDEVGTWEDQSGNGYDLTQNTATKYPLLKSAYMDGGTPAIKFDGTNDFMSVDFGTQYSQPNTVCIALDVVSASATRVFVSGYNDGTAKYQNTYIGSGNEWFLYAQSAYDSNKAVIAGNHVVLSFFKTTASYLRLDGSASTPNNAGAHDLVGLTVGATIGGSSFLTDGALAEVIIYNKELSAQEISDIETYLTDKHI